MTICHSEKATGAARNDMEQGVNKELIDTLLSLGAQDKERIKDNSELIELVKSKQDSLREYRDADWQEICESLSRDEHVFLSGDWFMQISWLGVRVRLHRLTPFTPD